MTEKPIVRAPRRRPPYAFEPETMTWAEAASVACRATESWLRDHIGDLDGFPRPDPMLEVFSAKAVRAWIDRRFGLAIQAPPPVDAEQIMLERIRNGTHLAPVSRRQTS